MGGDNRMAKSWHYQKNDRYKQVNIKFFMEDLDDVLLFHYLHTYNNYTEYLKNLIKDDMQKELDHNGNSCNN